MTAYEIVRAARQRGVWISTQGDDLRISKPERLTPDLSRWIESEREDVREWLRAEQLMHDTVELLVWQWGKLDVPPAVDDADELVEVQQALEDSDAPRVRRALRLLRERWAEALNGQGGSSG